METLPTLTSSDKLVVVVGLYATGKTTLCKKLKERYPQYEIIHTDEYIRYKDSLTAIKSVILYEGFEYVIIEGAAAYPWLAFGGINPHVVINCVTSDGKRQERYQSPERMGGKRYAGDRVGVKDYKAFDNMYRGYWQQFYHRIYVSGVSRAKLIEYET